MKKTHIILLILASSFISKGQSYEKGNLLISAGVRIGYYSTKSYLEGVHQKDDNNTAGNLNYPITAQYGISNKFSIGLRFQPASWGDDPEDDFKTSNTSNMFALVGEYHLLKSNKSDLYAELSVGTITWNQKHNDGTLPFPQVKGNIVNKYKGINYRAGLGYRIYLGNTIGLFWNVTYSYYGMKLKESIGTTHMFPDDPIDYMNNGETDFKIKTSGIEFTFIGLVVKI